MASPFEGRLAHQTLGMLLTRRLERARLRPLGFVANEYALAVWGLGDVAKEIESGGLSLGLFRLPVLLVHVSPFVRIRIIGEPNAASPARRP